MSDRDALEFGGHDRLKRAATAGELVGVLFHHKCESGRYPSMARQRTAHD
jgi:hypothetical protein